MPLSGLSLPNESESCCKSKLRSYSRAEKAKKSLASAQSTITAETDKV